MVTASGIGVVTFISSTEPAASLRLEGSTSPSPTVCRDYRLPLQTTVVTGSGNRHSRFTLKKAL